MDDNTTLQHGGQSRPIPQQSPSRAPSPDVARFARSARFTAATRARAFASAWRLIQPAHELVLNSWCQQLQPAAGWVEFTKVYMQTPTASSSLRAGQKQRRSTRLS
jgi:hypothetical protein